MTLITHTDSMGCSTKTFHATGQNPNSQHLGTASTLFPTLNFPAHASSSEGRYRGLQGGTHQAWGRPADLLPGTGIAEPVPSPGGIQDIDGKKHYPMKQP